MTYLVYMNNYHIRQCKAQYLSVLYEVIGRGLDAHFLLPTEYTENYQGKNRWEVKWAENNFGKYEDILKGLNSNTCTVIQKPENFVSMKAKVPSKILEETVFRDFVYERKVILNEVAKRKITAGVTWVNNKCFSSTLKALGIPTIHHELGPFRPPIYIPTAFLDFSGVNGDTEFDARFARFLRIANEVPILSRKELLKVISPRFYKELWRVLDNKNYKYEAGVGLQVEVDTNVLLFNGGYNWIDPILLAESETEGEILVRPHPMSAYELKGIAGRRVIDNVTLSKAYEFINKCKKVYCLNSSIGIEAILLGREAVILGENPFKSVCNMDEDTRLKALNFIVFGYLIHRNLLFSNDYYKFRLENKNNEKLIYLDNLDRLLKSSLKKGW